MAVVAALSAAVLVACESKGTKGADFCPSVDKTKASLDVVVGLLNSGEMPAPDALKPALDAYRADLAAMASASPAEIADDMLLVVNSFTAFDLGMQKVGYDYGVLFSDDEAAEAAQADMALMDAPETQTAMDTVAEYTLTKCGVRLDTSGE